MCMRKQVLKIGERIFNIGLVLTFIMSIAAAVLNGIEVEDKFDKQEDLLASGLVSGVLHLLTSWSLLLIIALIVYSLLEICHSLNKDNNES